MKSLKVLLEKPFFGWTDEEKEMLPELLQKMLDAGAEIIVLGQKRCFFCGLLIEPGSTGDTKKIGRGKGKGLIITNLCDACWGKAHARNP